jgi:hypothetical protein
VAFAAPWLESGPDVAAGGIDRRPVPGGLPQSTQAYRLAGPRACVTRLYQTSQDGIAACRAGRASWYRHAREQVRWSRRIMASVPQTGQRFCSYLGLPREHPHDRASPEVRELMRGMAWSPQCPGQGILQPDVSIRLREHANRDRHEALQIRYKADHASHPASRAPPRDSRLLTFHQFSAFARSVAARSGDGASQLEAECALIEVSAPVESPLAGSTGESARSAGNGPVASPVDGVRACRAGLIMIPREHERVTIGCGQRLDVDIRKPSGATGRT